MTDTIDLVNRGEFRELFLGLYWSLPKGLQPQTFSPLDDTWVVRPLARYHGLTAWECDGMPSRREQSEIRRGLLKKYDDIVLVFHDAERQVWVWPDVRFKLGGLARLTAHRHRVGDKNDVLARRLEAFRVDLDQTRTVSEILSAVRAAFDTDEEAGVRIARLHDLMIEAGMSGRDLEILLTRLLFLFFGDDTGLFGEADMFDRLLKASPEDGYYLPAMLSALFRMLDTPEEERTSTNADNDLPNLKFIGGNLFRDDLDIPAFDSQVRKQLIECSDLQWAEISPAIFGSMFQAVLDSEIAHVVDRGANYAMTRRALGAHYTSEPNILRVIEPLFLDGLNAELEDAGDDRDALAKLHHKIASLTFLDPACGCGNFLVVTYKQLRLLEIEILHRLHPNASASQGDDVARSMFVHVDQFNGLEISISAIAIANVALWITDHQLNVVAEGEFGTARSTLPLVRSPTIREADALRESWALTIPAENCDFVIGNPPYVGSSYQTSAQKESLKSALSIGRSGDLRRSGVLDFIAGWFVKAADYVNASIAGRDVLLEIDDPADEVEGWGSSLGGDAENADHEQRLRGTSDPYGTRAAFVSTNSIVQGDQVGVLWPWMLAQGMHIQFAHRTFQWSNGAANAAAVHCVIIGFGRHARSDLALFVYGDGITKDPRKVRVRHVSPYLVEGSDEVAVNRASPLARVVPNMTKGSQPTDGGALLLTADEMRSLREIDARVDPLIRQFLGADEFLNGKDRYCLWLVGQNLAELEDIPPIAVRLQQVRNMRLKSAKGPTRQAARTPHLFTEIRQTDQPYLLIPRVSSERRPFIPIGYLSRDVIASDAVFMLPNATLYHFGILCSTMHNAWMRTVAGRLKSDYRYSNTLVYNNFPWPSTNIDETSISEAGQAVLDARAEHPGRTLAQLYDPDLMPENLRLAHGELDRAVDAAYGYQHPDDDLPRVEFLFALYADLVANARQLRR